MDTSTFSSEKELLKKLYPKKTDFIENAIEDAIVIYRHLRNDDKQEVFDDNEHNWIKRCASELLKNSDYVGISKYSENGYSIEMYSSVISPILMREVFPKVKRL